MLSQYGTLVLLDKEFCDEKWWWLCMQVCLTLLNCTLIASQNGKFYVIFYYNFSY